MKRALSAKKWTKASKITAVILVVVLFLIIMSCVAITHEYGLYYGKVIDKETAEPIEGAAVLLAYFTAEHGLAGSVSHYVDAQETLTDKKGEFRIPAKRLFTFRPLSSWEPYPQVRIFKPGYGCYPRHKEVAPKFDYGSLPANQNVTIELPQLTTREERLRNLSCRPVAFPDIAMKIITKTINIERLNLGLEPYEETAK